jgi:hypothetical protein
LALRERASMFACVTDFSLQHVCLRSRATIRSTPERETSAFDRADIAILRVRHHLSCNIVIAVMRTHGM